MKVKSEAEELRRMCERWNQAAVMAGFRIEKYKDQPELIFHEIIENRRMLVSKLAEAMRKERGEHGRTTNRTGLYQGCNETRDARPSG